MTDANRRSRLRAAGVPGRRRNPPRRYPSALPRGWMEGFARGGRSTARARFRRAQTTERPMGPAASGQSEPVCRDRAWSLLDQSTLGRGTIFRLGNTTLDGVPSVTKLPGPSSSRGADETTGTQYACRTEVHPLNGSSSESNGIGSGRDSFCSACVGTTGISARWCCCCWL